MLKSYAEIIITPQELQFHKVLNRRILIQRNDKILIEGKILDHQLKPVEGAIIVVKSIDCNYHPPKIIDYGYIISNDNGSYAINLKEIKNVKYKLYIYEPLIRL